MQPKHFTVCAAFFAAAAGAGAAPASPFVQADSLRQLPAAVQQQLGVDQGAIADRDERFNAGCVVSGKEPRQRFLLGAVAADLVLVAIEVGGIAHYSRTLEWRRQGDTWVRAERRNARPFPRTLQELLQEDSPRAVAVIN